MVRRTTPSLVSLKIGLGEDRRYLNNTPDKWFLRHGSVEKFLHRGSMERVLYHGSMEDCADSLLGIKHHNRFVHRGSMEKFLHCGSVERVLYHGSMEDCANPLLGIKHHNESSVMVAWRSSYTMEVWKGSYIVEAWKIMLIRFLVSSPIMIPTLWKHGDVSMREMHLKTTRRWKWLRKTFWGLF